MPSWSDKMPPRGLQERPKRVQETELGLKLLGNHQGISFLARSQGILVPIWRILASKTPPRASKTPPRRVQEPSRRPQKRSRCPQEPPGCILGASVRSAILREFCSWRVPGNLGSSRPPRRLQQPPGHLQKPPRRFQDASKMPSATSKTRSGRVQYAPRTSKTPKMSPSWRAPQAF